MMIQGIQPGPQVLSSHPELFWGLIVSFWIGNVFLVILNIPLIGMWVRLLMIPYPLLYPGIVLFTCVGVFSTNNNVVRHLRPARLRPDRLRDDAAAPRGRAAASSATSSGPPFEENLRRALLLSRGDFGVFVHRPISAAALALAAALVAWAIWSYLRGKGGVPDMEELAQPD